MTKNHYYTNDLNNLNDNFKRRYNKLTNKKKKRDIHETDERKNSN